MANVLHILKSEPDETIAGLIEDLAGEEGVTVVSLYDDKISGATLDWGRLVDDIFTFDRVICWW